MYNVRLTAKNIWTERIEIPDEQVLSAFAESLPSHTSISLEMGDGSQSVFWTVRAAEIDHDEKKIDILIVTVSGEALLQFFFEGDNFHATLRNLDGAPTNFEHYENGHLCLHGGQVIEIDF